MNTTTSSAAIPMEQPQSLQHPRRRRQLLRYREDLIHAIEQHDDQRVEHLLALGADPGWRPPDGADETYILDATSALVAAYKAQNLWALERLLKAGAWVDGPTRNENRPPLLAIAAESAEIEVCRLLLAAKADIWAVGDDGYPAIACGLQHPAVVQAVINAGAAGPSASDGESLLHLACDLNFKDAVTVLMCQGFDPEEVDKYGKNAFSKTSAELQEHMVILRQALKAQSAVDILAAGLPVRLQPL